MTEQHAASINVQALNYGYLADQPGMLPALSAALYEQWGHRSFWQSRAMIEERFKTRMRRDGIPFTLVAVPSTDADAFIGTASITLHELPEFSDRRYWLSEVCVNPVARGNGIGQHLVEMCQERARECGVAKLSLYTLTKANFYKRLGWQHDDDLLIEGLNHNLMSIDLR